MVDKYFIKFLFKIFEKLLNVHLEIKGEENIPKDKSILFCANHFTRFETLLLPYILINIENLKYTRSLAHKDLFVGKVGKYLREAKVISTGDANRDEIIIDDLISDRYNWIIYPEGQMIKDKKIFTTKPSPSIEYNLLKTSARTGVATLAMRAEQGAKNKGEIYICPITISYRPIYAKKNNIYLLIKRFIEKPNIPKVIKNDLFFESSLLAHSTICVHFHKGISVAEYMQQASSVPEDLKIERLRFALTNDIMYTIYKNSLLTFDHFFAFCISCLIDNNILQIDIHILNEFIFNMIALSLTYKNELIFSRSINHFNALRLILKGEKNEMLNLALLEMKLKGLGYIENEVLYIQKEEFLKERDYDEVRIKNIFQVLLNQFLFFRRLSEVLRNIVLKNHDLIKKENGYLILKLLQTDCSTEHPLREFSDVGVLMCGGFNSSQFNTPELEDMFNKNGFSTYKLNLKDCSIRQQDYSYSEYAILAHNFASEGMFRVCKQVFAFGSSFGSLLAIINAKKFNYRGVVAIEVPLKVASFKSYIEGLFHTIKDFIHPHKVDPCNEALNEFEEIIKIGNSNFKFVKLPILITETDTEEDGGDALYNHVSSRQKEIISLNENSIEECQKTVLGFLKRNQLRT